MSFDDYCEKTWKEPINVDCSSAILAHPDLWDAYSHGPQSKVIWIDRDEGECRDSWFRHIGHLFTSAQHKRKAWDLVIQQRDAFLLRFGMAEHLLYERLSDLEELERLWSLITDDAQPFNADRAKAVVRARVTEII